jgi:hypothetical protein
MGMFSWCCKGCGHELKADELVRMNGCKGTYDGYGGNSGGFDSDGCEVEPACWHEACYRKATQEERADKTPSRHAPNQGFGHPALAFLKGYKEEAKTEYRVVVHTFGEPRRELHAVPSANGYELSDYLAYRAAYDNCEGPELPDNFYEMTDDERDDFLLFYREEVEKKLGMKNPENNQAHFPSLEEARKVADSLVSDIPEYDLLVLGRQGKVEGLCYERIRNMKYRRTAEGIEPTGEFREDVEYEHGVSALLVAGLAYLLLATPSHEE